MAAQGSASAADDDLWSKLPGDLLGEVYSRIVSPRHRIRFTAVCTSWRAAAWRQPPLPAIPWLVLLLNSTERVFSPADGAMLRPPFSSTTTGKNPVGFYDGGWVAATTQTVGHGASLVIVNLFSGVEVPLSAKQRFTPQIIWKVAFSEAPTSKHCILAAVTHGLALCRVGCRNHSWRKSRTCHSYDDMVFCRGKLYGLYGEAVFMHDIRMAKNGSPVVGAVSVLRTVQSPSWGLFWSNNIVEYEDTLLMVQRAPGLSVSPHGSIFKLFELVKTEENASYDYMWAEVTTLDDHALFLGYKCSKVVHVPASGLDRVERNHIYYHHKKYLREHESICDDVQLTWDSAENLHCMKK